MNTTIANLYGCLLEAAAALRHARYAAGGRVYDTPPCRARGDADRARWIALGLPVAPERWGGYRRQSAS